MVKTVVTPVEPVVDLETSSQFCIPELKSVFNVVRMAIEISMLPVATSFFLALVFLGITGEMSEKWISILFVPTYVCHEFLTLVSAFYLLKGFKFRTRDNPHVVISDKNLMVLMLKTLGVSGPLLLFLCPWTMLFLYSLGVSSIGYAVHFIALIVLANIGLLLVAFIWTSIKQKDSHAGRVIEEKLRKKGKKMMSPMKYAFKESYGFFSGSSAAALSLLILKTLPNTFSLEDNLSLLILFGAVGIYKALGLAFLRSVKLAIGGDESSVSTDIAYFLVLVNIQVRIFVGMQDTEEKIYYATLTMAFLEIILRSLATLFVRLHIRLSQNALEKNVSKFAEKDSWTRKKNSIESMEIKFKRWKNTYMSLHSAELFVEMMSEYIGLATTVLVFWVVNEKSSVRVHFSGVMIAFQFGLEIVADFVSVWCENQLGVPIIQRGKFNRNLGIFHKINVAITGLWSIFIGVLIIFMKI